MLNSIKSRKKLEDENLARVNTAWTMFEAIRKNMKVEQNDLDGMQKVMRAFAVEVVRQQPYQDRIIVGEGLIDQQVLIRFPNKKFVSKEAYLQYHSQNYEWGEDALMYPALEALGYQPVMHLQDTHVPPYVPFVQQCSKTPQQIDIVNHGAKEEGFHWELQGQSNPGRGNCMYYTMAQQVQKDYLPKIFDEEEVLFMQETLKAANKTSGPIIFPQITVQSENEITLKVTAESKEYEKLAQARKKDAAEMLNRYSTIELAQFYQIAMQDSDYLPGRLTEIEKEMGITAKDNPVRTAVEFGKVNGDLEDLIRKELLHALSTEAWKDEKHYNALVSISTPKNTTCSEEARLGALQLNPENPWKAPQFVMK